ncbi:MAG: hypothetical protein WC908_00535 [Candidatus Paceibacterota bacterium]
MLRQTKFTLDQILELLENPNSTYPSCMLINEIGIMCFEQKDSESEKALLSFLEAEEPDRRIISFCFLYGIKEMQKKHDVLLSKFRINPENQEYLEEIDSMIFRSADLFS